MIVSLKKAATHTRNILNAGLVPFIAGAPGVGKSDLVRQTANELNLQVIDHRLSTSDPTDMNGLPAIVNGTATFATFDLFPTEERELPPGKDGWLLFLDELPGAAPAVQLAAYKLILDRMVGQKNLHSKVHMVAAGNRRSDNAVAGKIGTAMQSRLIHLEVEANSEDWLAWAYAAGVDPRVTSYIGYAPEKLDMFDPQHSDKTFPCPRTWHFLSKYAKANDISFDHMPAIAGTIGEGPARDFLAYCEVGSKLPDYSVILAKPTTTAIPDEPSTTYFVCGSIAAKTGVKELPSIVKYVERMPIEFQIICFRDMFKRQPTVKKDPIMRKWVMANAKHLFADD